MKNTYITGLAAFLCLFLAFGCSDDDAFPVPPASTVARFSAEIMDSPFAPATVQFTNQSIVPEYAGPATYTWSFGDGAVSTEENPTHTYTRPGKFTVKLVTASQKQIAEYTSSITIKDPNAVGTQLLFTDRNTGTIQNILINSQEPVNAQFTSSTFNRPYYLLADVPNNRLYISDFEAGTISYTSLDGDGAAQVLLDGLDGPGQLALDEENQILYWTTSSKVQQASAADPASPGGITDVVTGQTDDPEGLVYHAASNTLYWATYDGGLWKMPVGGSATEIIPGVFGQAVQIIEDQLFYYSYDDGGYSIFRSDLNGANPALFATGMNGDVYGIAYDEAAGKVYWSDQRNGIIWRANPNGTEKEEWFTDTSMRIYSVVTGKTVE